MTHEEMLVVGEKIRAGTASTQEQKIFFDALADLLKSTREIIDKNHN